MAGTEHGSTAAPLELEKHPAGSPIPRPFAPRFYEELIGLAATADERETFVLDRLAGRSVHVRAGELLSFELLEGPQIVCVFPVNASDPDERYWASQTALSEGMFLRRTSRLWGTMARYRPLLTIVDDALSDRATAVGHHPTVGAWPSSMEWRAGGGAAGVPSVWEQLAAAATTCALDPQIVLRDHAALFERVTVDAITQRWLVAPSEAVAGDRVSLFAEIDLDVLLSVHPLIDGSRSPKELDGAEPRRVEVRVTYPVAEPIGWPYPGQPYPDLSLYLNDAGVRSDEPVPTAGRESA